LPELPQLVLETQDMWTDSFDDGDGVPWDEARVTQLPSVELRDGFLMPQDSCDNHVDEAIVRQLPNVEHRDGFLRPQDSCDNSVDKAIVTQLPNVELRDGFLMPQDSSDGRVVADHVPDDEGPRCCLPMRRATSGVTCPRRCPRKREGASGIAKFARTTGSCLRFNDAKQLTDTKPGFHGSLSADYGLITPLSEAGQEMTKHVQQAVARLGTGKRPEAALQANAREERQRITGSICIVVRYTRVLGLADDLGVLHVGDGGRVFVSSLNSHGIAFQRGVRPGDELVRIRVNHGTSRVPDASPQYLQQLAMEPGMAHQFCEAFFMGFVGQFPAEVSVSSTNVYKSELSGTLGKITGYTPFSVVDYAAFGPSCDSLLLASKCNKRWAHTACTDPDNDGCPWQLLELKRQQARELLAAAILSPRPAVKQPESWV